MTEEIITDFQTTASPEVVRADELFRRMISGDDAAFEALFEAFDGKLRRYLTRQMGSERSAAAVDDLLQDVWIRFINLRRQPGQHAAGAGDGPFHVQAFLFRVAHNLVIDRRRTRKDHTSIDELEDEYQPRTEVRNDPDAEELVERAFDRLPEDFREVLVLHLHLGYRFDEIAEMLGKTSDAIWQRASRARARLRRLVVEMAKKEGVCLGAYASGPSEKGQQDGE